jgi:hypothetical protein
MKACVIVAVALAIVGLLMSAAKVARDAAGAAGAHMQKEANRWQ